MLAFLFGPSLKACIVLAMLAPSIAAFPARETASQLGSVSDIVTLEPHDTLLAKFWQETGDWRNGSANEGSFNKRINLPNGRSQFVSWQNVGGGVGNYNNYIISLAVVVYTTGGTARCNGIWQSLGTSSAVASAVAVNAIDAIRAEGWSSAFPSQLPAYYTYNYYGSMVVVAKLFFSNYDLNTVRFMAGSLSNAWGLGDVISNYTPVNSKRDETDQQGAGGVITSGSFTPDETGQLLNIIANLGTDSVNDTINESNIQKRGNNCYNWNLSECRNSGWSVWNTDYDYTCPPGAY